MGMGFRWASVLGVALLSEACSFSFVDGPPDRHEKLLYFDCTSSAGPQVTDVAIATLTGLAAIGAAEGDDSGAAALGGVTAVFGASAIYGIINTSACNKAKDELRIRLMKIFEREAQLRALEAQREHPRDLHDVLSRKSRAGKPTPTKPIPVVLEEDVPPAPPPPAGGLPPAPPPAPAAAPAPAAPGSSAPPPAPPPPATAAPKPPAPAPAPVPKAPAPAPDR